jgi:hypothetical protein
MAAASPSELDAYHARLRKDVLVMQTVLEAAGKRNALSFEARRVEEELLRSSHEHTAEDRMVSLLRLVERKAAELASVTVTSNAGGDAALPPGLQPAVLRSGAGAGGAVLGPLLEALLKGRTLPTPPESRGPADSMELEGPSRVNSHATLGVATSMTNFGSKDAGDADGAFVPSEAVKRRLEALGVKMSNQSSVSAITVIEQLLAAAERVQWERDSAVSAAASAKAAQSNPPTKDAGRPPVTPSKAVTIATPPVMDASSPMHSMMLTSKESSLHQQALIELEVLRGKVAAKERELNDMRHQLSSSRYAFNAPRTLTTVHDAPMSFEVERQYQRELHRLANRVKELEEEYKTLLESGADDRQKVKDLTADGIRLRDEIARNRQTLVQLQSDRDEQHSLFSGVSKARGEEARMSLVAVKQLENRVADLEDKLKKRTEECRLLSENGEALWDLWHGTDAELARATLDLGEARSLFDAFNVIYNDGMARALEEALLEVHRLGRLCDEQTALTTIQKQRLDDSEMLRALTVHEQQLWMEKLKGSTEWKMLNVKSPDETKQLAVRIMMLTGEKEKKENTMIASHGERLQLFKTRADKEVADRCERREAAMPLQESAAAEGRWQKAQDDISARCRKERERVATLGQGGRTTKLRYADVKAAFLAETHKRSVDFRSFFNDEVEARAASEVK